MKHCSRATWQIEGSGYIHYYVDFCGISTFKDLTVKVQLPLFGVQGEILTFYPSIYCKKKIPCRFKRLTLVKRNTIRKEAQGV